VTGDFSDSWRYWEILKEFRLTGPRQIAPFADAVDRLDAIPGINIATAQAIISEVRVDMTRFPTATGKGNRFLARVLGEAAVSAGKTDTFIDLGPDHYDTRGGTQRAIRHHLRRLQELGYQVTLNPAA
jgi:hypothetical protein